MSIKAGQIITFGSGGFLLDRVQSAGPGNLNIPIERIKELGNYKSVATIRDTPDLSFGLESFDMSIETEDFLTGGLGNFTTGVDLSTCRPVDIASQFKSGVNETSPFAVIASVAIPFLYCESASYRFAVQENSSETFSLRGDSIYYNPGPSYIQTATTTGSANQAVATTNPAYQVAEGDARRVLSVEIGTQRLTFGADYTETYGSITSGAAVTTVHITDAYTASQTIRIMYASPTALSYLQSVHPLASEKPAAVRGRDIDVYVGGYDPEDIAGSQVNKLVSVQSATLDWRVTLDKDFELGNPFSVGQDFDTPDVSGTVQIKPRGPGELAATIRLIQGVADATKVLGAQTAVPLELDYVIRVPGSSEVIKRLHVPDARFSLPGYTGRVDTKTVFDMNFASDEGSLVVFQDEVASS